MSNYTENQYTDDKNNSWSIVFDLIRDKDEVLDVGCSSGNFGAELIKRKQCIVDGIDVDAKDNELAKKQLRNAYVIDVEKDELTKLNKKYDAILMMDVIEHLIDPVVALDRIATLLKPNGRLVFSVPNMAHISVRLDLLLGTFEYRKVGLLDHTHLHFYTEESLLNTLKSAGFSVTETKSSTVSYPEKLLRMKLKEAGLEYTSKFGEEIEASKGNVYQFIGAAKHTKVSKRALIFPATNPHEVHYEEAEAATKAYYEQLIANIKEELKLKDQHVKNLESELNTIHNSKSYKVTRKAANTYRKLKKNASDG